MKWNMKKLFLSVIFFSFSAQAYEDFVGKQEKINTCFQKYNMFISASQTSDNVGQYAIICKQACDQSSWSFKNNEVQDKFNACSGGGNSANNALGAAQKCLAAKAKVNGGQQQESSVWDTCVADCKQAIGETTKDNEKSVFSAVANQCSSQKASDIVDPNGDINGDSGTSADNSGGNDKNNPDNSLEPADSGSPNDQALNNLMSGVVPSGSSSIDPGRGVDFTRGTDGQANFSEVANTSGPAEFQSTTGYPRNYVDDRVQYNKPPQQQPPQQNPAMPGHSGMAGMPPNRPQPTPTNNGGGGGGGRMSIAGAQLGKLGQSGFWSGGGSTTSGGGVGRKMATTVVVPKDKKFGPNYLSKGMGDGGLLKLFGSPLKTTSLPGGSQSCSDQTVFCTLEGFFDRVERYPSSEEIKQTP